jgi:hypothetical protein
VQNLVYTFLKDDLLKERKQLAAPALSIFQFQVQIVFSKTSTEDRLKPHSPMYEDCSEPVFVKLLKEPMNRFLAWRARTTTLFIVRARKAA